MVVSGLPWLTYSKKAGNHEIEIVEMAFDMLDNIATLINPTNNKPMRIRVGKLFLIMQMSFFINTNNLEKLVLKNILGKILEFNDKNNSFIFGPFNVFFKCFKTKFDISNQTL